MYGEVDDCFSKWTAFFDCLKKKTKYKEEVGGWLLLLLPRLLCTMAGGAQLLLQRWERAAGGADR